MVGIGRPPEGPEARTRVLSVRLTVDERKQFDLQRGGMTRGQYLRRLMEEDGKKSA